VRPVGDVVLAVVLGHDHGVQQRMKQLDGQEFVADFAAERFYERVDVHPGASQVIEIRNAPSKAFTPTQLRHVRGAIEEIVRALES